MAAPASSAGACPKGQPAAALIAIQPLGTRYDVTAKPTRSPVVKLAASSSLRMNSRIVSNAAVQHVPAVPHLQQHKMVDAQASRSVNIQLFLLAAPLQRVPPAPHLQHHNHIVRFADIQSHEMCLLASCRIQRRCTSACISAIPHLWPRKSALQLLDRELTIRHRESACTRSLHNLTIAACPA